MVHKKVNNDNILNPEGIYHINCRLLTPQENNGNEFNLK
jgi:hypothetical protein